VKIITRGAIEKREDGTKVYYLGDGIFLSLIATRFILFFVVPRGIIKTSTFVEPIHVRGIDEYPKARCVAMRLNKWAM
jgi:hypothetical protein